MHTYVCACVSYFRHDLAVLCVTSRMFFPRPHGVVDTVFLSGLRLMLSYAGHCMRSITSWIKDTLIFCDYLKRHDGSSNDIKQQHLRKPAKQGTYNNNSGRVFRTNTGFMILLDNTHPRTQYRLYV